jgi:epidermal growth factor receptor substrate 15
MPAGGAPVIPPQATGLQAQHSGPIRVPPLTNDRITEYMRLFERAGSQNGLLSGMDFRRVIRLCTNSSAGDIARTSFELSGLPSEVLAAIWNLVDTEQRGSLNVTEFIIAMHLLASYKAKTLTALPPTIPPGLYEAASRRPGAVPANLRSPTTRPGDLGPIPRQTSGSSAPRGIPARQFTGPGSADWLIGPREKVSYDELFDKVDTLRQGYVSGEQAVLFFSDSGLPSEVLAAIWDLANIRRLDQLNRDEFAVAMYLIRNQRGKSQPDLPSELPPNLIPPSLRSNIQPQSTGLQFPGPPTGPPVPAPLKSNADDLFGLDALTSSPPAAPQVQKDLTGGSGPLSRSTDLDPFGSSSSPSSQQKFSARGPPTSFFKPFNPQSSFGHALASQDTGASTASGRSAAKQPSAADDLLGDNDPQESKKLTQDSGDLANMSNQMGMLRTQMQAVQTKKSVAENELASNSTQKRDMELRLQQFRNQYEQEVSALKGLEDRLAKERGEVAQLSQQISLVQSSFQDVQSRHREAATTLESTKRENAALKDRLRQMNEYIQQSQPEIERMQSELRREKGLVAIQKKQAEKLDEDKAHIDKSKSELEQFRRQESARPSSSSRDLPTSSAASTGSSTNPFMKRTPQASIDNTISPSGFSRTLSNESNKFENIFGTTFATSPATVAPNTSFRDAFAHPGSSVKSSEPDMPTPSTSPPQSSYQDSPHQVPIQSVSRQITSNDLPLSDKSRDNDSLATSVRVETPGSRYDFSTPTNVASSPHEPTIQRTESSRSGPQSTGAAMFNRDVSTSSPVTSLKSEASRATSRPNDHSEGFFSATQPKQSQPFSPRGTALEPAHTGASTASDREIRPEAPAPPPPRNDSFPAPPGQGPSNGRGDFDSAFVSLAKSDPRVENTLKSPQDPIAKFDNKFPPIENEFPAEFAAVKPKPKDEFPPIAINDEDSGSDTDTQGFDDDFTKASPQQKFGQKSQTQDRDFGQASQEFSNIFHGAPPAAPDAPPGAFDEDDFSDAFAPPPPQQKSEAAKQQSDKTFGAPSSGSAGHALFGGPSAAKSPANPTSTFSTSPPETSRSDTYQSAVSHQSDTDNDFSPIDAAVSQGSTSKPSAFDDFDTGFDDLTDAKEDDRENDDLFFGSNHTDEHDFLPSFDSPTASGSMPKPNQSLDRSAASSGKLGFGSDLSFGDFDVAFPSSKGPTSAPPPTDFVSSKSGNSGAPNSWDAMMKGVELDSSASAATPAAPEAPRSVPTDKIPKPSNSYDDHGPSFPEAPEPPKLGRAISQGTEHDDPILKKLTGMGYPRPLALAALEKFDYDIGKVRISLEFCYK